MSNITIASHRLGNGRRPRRPRNFLLDPFSAKRQTYKMHEIYRLLGLEFGNSIPDDGLCEVFGNKFLIDVNQLEDLEMTNTSKMFEMFTSEINYVSSNLLNHDEAKFFLEQKKLNRNTYTIHNTYIVPNKFELEEWVSSNFSDYQMYLGEFGVAYINGTDWKLRFQYSIRRDNLSCNISGPEKEVKKFKDWLFEQGFKKEEICITWAFGPDYRNMESYDLPLQILPPLNKAYPWLNKEVEDFTDEFMNANASILVLIGPPGTGKTSFIKRMIQQAETKATVTYDTDLLFTDGFFASFMTSEDSNILVLEDADAVIGSRKEGNTIMHRFLNASDGLVSIHRKKIIFTTNLPSTADIDPALLRQGRCFDVVKFRNLTKSEAQVVAKQLYKEDVILDKDNYNLAEITNLSQRRVNKLTNKVGFI